MGNQNQSGTSRSDESMTPAEMEGIALLVAAVHDAGNGSVAWEQAAIIGGRTHRVLWDKGYAIARRLRDETD